MEKLTMPVFNRKFFHYYGGCWTPYEESGYGIPLLEPDQEFNLADLEKAFKLQLVDLSDISWLLNAIYPAFDQPGYAFDSFTYWHIFKLVMEKLEIDPLDLPTEAWKWYNNEEYVPMLAFTYGGECFYSEVAEALFTVLKEIFDSWEPMLPEGYAETIAFVIEKRRYPNEQELPS